MLQRYYIFYDIKSSVVTFWQVEISLLKGETKKIAGLIRKNDKKNIEIKFQFITFAFSQPKFSNLITLHNYKNN